ncbi:hypothetical protein EDD17DRAFT_1892132 [Pisolithus thermaeus]|nr:hypothetical protein EV401DRAFT_1894313 [Pisolithus croceorrhizus]KAI6169840.1 hypothetical protein EDD17DRAFT_1892132 [Pisolithus thermaeus]
MLHVEQTSPVHINMSSNTQCNCNAKWVPLAATYGGVVDELAFLPSAVAAPLTTVLAPLAPAPATTKFSPLLGLIGAINLFLPRVIYLFGDNPDKRTPGEGWKCQECSGGAGQTGQPGELAATRVLERGICHDSESPRDRSEFKIGSKHRVGCLGIARSGTIETATRRWTEGDLFPSSSSAERSDIRAIQACLIIALYKELILTMGQSSDIEPIKLDQHDSQRRKARSHLCAPSSQWILGKTADGLFPAAASARPEAPPADNKYREKLSE